MTDEVPGEQAPQLEDKGEEFGAAESGYQLEDEESGSQSTDRTLISDFCPHEGYAEEYGEQIWVCGPTEEQEGYYEEEAYYAGEAAEEEEPCKEDQKSLDSEYLKAALGTPLTFALLDVATKRPTDPIQYLGYYLMNWRWSGFSKTKYEEEMKSLNAEREALLNKQREKERQAMLREEEREEELRRAEREESLLDDEDLGEGQEFDDDV